MIRARASVLVALVVVVLYEVMRVSFPLLYELADDVGFDQALWVLPVIFASPFVLAPVVAMVGTRWVLAVSAVGLAVARVVMQVQLTPHVTVALVGLMLGLIALAVALSLAARSDGPQAASAAIFLGLALDTGIRLTLVTWDAAWQHTFFANAVGTIGPAALIVVTVAVARTADVGAHLPWRLAAFLGPLFALQVLCLANPAFMASSGAVDLGLAGAVTLIGLGLAAAAPARPGFAMWAARGLLVAALAVLTGPSGLTGIGVLFVVALGQASVGALTTSACATPVGDRPQRSPRMGWTDNVALGAGTASLALVAVLLPYQISYEIPLGVPQAVFGALGAVALVLLAGRAAPVQRSSSTPWPRRVAIAAPVAMMPIPIWLILDAPDGSSTDESAHRVVTYNVHSVINTGGRLDPEGIARVIENGGANVALLQELSRGWPLSGGLDNVEWLSRRLDMEFSYGSAADNQFGNAVLSDRPIAGRWAETMDRGEGTMRRGFVGAEIAGEPSVSFVSTHLQHQDHTTATRQAQARQVMAGGDDELTVFGGDFNSRPASADIEPWFDGTSLVSILEETPGGPWHTSPVPNPDHRVDWLIVTPDLGFADVSVPHTTASDHLPIFATVTP